MLLFNILTVSYSIQRPLPLPRPLCLFPLRALWNYNDPLCDCFSAFFPFLDITRRSLLLAKGNHWRLGTQAETAVLYNCPEMRSCGGARGSKLTTNIITVGAVEEVGERAGGGRRVYATQASNWFFVCLFYGGSR